MPKKNLHPDESISLTPSLKAGLDEQTLHVVLNAGPQDTPEGRPRPGPQAVRDSTKERGLSADVVRRLIEHLIANFDEESQPRDPRLTIEDWKHGITG